MSKVSSAYSKKE